MFDGLFIATGAIIQTLADSTDGGTADFYLRTIYSATLQREGDLLRLRLHGNGFMYRMVRLLVGTAHQVARGRMSLDALRGMLENPHGDKTRYCAPAGGLYLRRVFYT